MNNKRIILIIVGAGLLSLLIQSILKEPNTYQQDWLDCPKEYTEVITIKQILNDEPGICEPIENQNIDYHFSAYDVLKDRK